MTTEHSEPLDLSLADRVEPSILRTKIDVPEGFTLPCGTIITDGFPLVVEYGARWHSEWDGPKVTVNGWRFLPAGDQLGWAGDSIYVFASLLPKDVIELATAHGMAPADDVAAGKYGFSIPTAPQPDVTFLTKRPHEIN